MDIPSSSDPVKPGMTTPTPPEGEKLLPCPFCGGKELEAFPNSVSCQTCDAHGPEHDVGCYSGKVGDRHRADAITAWNTRAEHWQPIETAPKDGSFVKVRGGEGPYGVTSWEGVAKWHHPINTHSDRSSWASPIGAMLHLAGYEPEQWSPLPAPLRAAP